MTSSQNSSVSSIDEQPQIQDTMLTVMAQQGVQIPNIKRKIRFSIESSSRRRNVDKHIIRVILVRYPCLQEDILKELLNYGCGREEYEQIMNVLANLKEKERQKEAQVKKDYTKVINLFLSRPSFMLIFKLCVEVSLTAFMRGLAPRIWKQNLEVYRKTLQDYLSYVYHTIKRNN